jgi:DMSO reductase anchor subunit
MDRAQLETGWVAALLAASAVGTVAQLGVLAHLVATVRWRQDRQYRGTRYLLLERFRGLFLSRLICAVVGLALLASALAVPVSGPAAAARIGTGLLVLGGGELIGRYLFYVTVVPYGMAGSFFSPR